MLRFGMIGVGNMAGAILEGALNAGAIAARDTAIFELNDARAAALCEKHGVRRIETAQALIDNSDIVLIGVKPNQMEKAVAGLSFKGKAVISIAAGWGSDSLRALMPGARLLRVMPNTPALVGAGMTSMSLNHTLTDQEAGFAERLFSSIGLIEWMDEPLMEAATGLAGSGPAYVFLFLEAMADGGVAMGLPRAAAMRMAAQTLMGGCKMAMESGQHPGAMKDAVASPAGTTIDAIRSLEKNGFRSAVMEAVVVAAEKAIRMKK